MASEVQKVATSVPVERFLAKDGTLRLAMGPARKGWKVRDVDGFSSKVRELITGEVATAELEFERRILVISEVREGQWGCKFFKFYGFSAVGR